MTPFPVHIRFARVLVVILVVCAAFAGCGDNNVGGKAESVAALAGAAGGPGFFDGSPSDPVRFDSPSAVAVTTTGDRFVADTENHVIRRIDASGNVTTFAGAFGVSGSADGTGAAARFNKPTGIIADGTTLYISDTGNHTIRKMISASGIVTTLAGTPGTEGFSDNPAGPDNVLFRSPGGIAVGIIGLEKSLIVADTGNHSIRRVSLTGATVTYAGSGAPGFDNAVGTSASFNSPRGVTFDGSSIFVADTGNHAIRQIIPAGSVGSVSTLAGDGTPGYVDNTSGASVRFSSPVSLASVGSDLYVSDTGNHVIRKVNTTNLGFTTTPAGSPQIAGSADGTGGLARFHSPEGITSDGLSQASLYVADTGNHAVRRVTLGGSVTTVAGNPPQAGLVNATGESARFDAPAGVAVIGDDLFVSDQGNDTIRKITSSGVVTSFTGGVFSAPQGIVAQGSDLYVADSENHAIRKVTSAGVVSTFAGSDAGVEGFADGTGTAARFRVPKGVATDGSFLYVADTGNHAIRKIELGTGIVTTVAGDGLSGMPTDTPSRFKSPEGVAVLGSDLYVADTGNHAIQKVTPAGFVSTYAGSDAGVPGFADDTTGTAARFDTPRGIAAVDSVLYVADTGNHVIRTISTLRKVNTFVGNSGAATMRNGDSTDGLMNAPVGITGSPGTIYFTDINENVVRKILF